jgi:DNA-binding transcriptional LysR family regulator
MSAPDLNLLVTLDAVLAEGSVARAAQRLRLSPSAMSRALARLREATGDPLLVRAGRGLVPTPRALELRDRAARVLEEARATLRPAPKLDLRRLARTFTLRVRDGFVESFGAELVRRARGQAPGARLYFVQKQGKESAPLRDGTVDLDTAVVGRSASPELRSRTLFRDRFVGVVRAGHPLSGGEVSAERFAAGRHVMVSRRGTARGPLDDALGELGLAREVATLVSGFSAALSLARATDLIATVPERHTLGLREGMHTFPIPVPVPELPVALLWHPRMDADPAHRWLRELVLEICGAR